jgi:hypothetical protein
MKRQSAIRLTLGIVFLLACTLSKNIPGNSSPGSSSQEGQPAEPGSGVGPATLAMDDPNLNKQATSSASSQQQYVYEGIDMSGAPYTVTWDSIYMEQIEPQWASYNFIKTSWNGSVDPDDTREQGFLDGKGFSIDKDKCYVNPDTYTHEPWGIFLNPLAELEGTVKRVEEGVEINGVLTDRYELKGSNVSAYETATKEFRSGSLWRAREGGYLVRIEYVLVLEHTSLPLEEQFDPSKPIVLTNRYNLTYYAPGEAFIKLPDLCVGQ